MASLLCCLNRKESDNPNIVITGETRCPRALRPPQATGQSQDKVVLFAPTTPYCELLPLVVLFTKEEHSSIVANVSYLPDFAPAAVFLFQTALNDFGIGTALKFVTRVFLLSVNLSAPTPLA